VRPGLPVLETSARNGAGMAAWLARIEELAAAARAPAADRLETGAHRAGIR